MQVHPQICINILQMP